MVERIIKSFEIWTDAQGVKSKGRVKNIENISFEGITSLRKLILELAVRGKLVAQIPSDEPSNKLIEKIKREKATLVADGILKKEKALSQIADEEKPFGLPKNWSWVRLGEIGSTNIGLTYAPKNVSTDGTLVLRSSNIQNGEIDLADNVRVNLEIKDAVLVNKGDLLICARNGSRSLVGKCAIIKSLPEPMAFGAFMAIYRSSLNEYVKVFLNSPIYRRSLDDVETTTINQITQENLKNTVIPLPPLAEQHRIVAKVEELMGLCDALEKEKTASLKTHQTLVAALLQTLTAAKDAGEVESAWYRLAPHFDTLFCTEDSIDQLKQTILQLAIMGRLVKQDPADEPASELLKKIQKEKEKLAKEGKIKKEKALAEIRDEEKPFALPEGWEWVRLGAITQINPRNDKDGNLKVSFVPMALVTTSYKGEHGQEERTWNEISKGFTHFADGDVGVAKITPCFENSKAVVFSNLINGYGAGTTELHIARPFGKTIEARFILLILKSPEYLKLGESKMTGTAGQKRLSKEFFSENPMPLPPLEEQKRIVAKVDALMALCDNLKGRLLKSQEIQSNLSKTIIENAVA